MGWHLSSSDWEKNSHQTGIVTQMEMSRPLPPLWLQICLLKSSQNKQLRISSTFALGPHLAICSTTLGLVHVTKICPQTFPAALPSQQTHLAKGVTVTPSLLRSGRQIKASAIIEIWTGQVYISATRISFQTSPLPFGLEWPPRWSGTSYPTLSKDTFVSVVFAYSPAKSILLAQQTLLLSWHSSH